MKSIRFALATLALTAAIFASGAGALADNTRSIVVTNSTPYTLTAFYASWYNDSGWDTTNNLLAGNTVQPGQTTTVYINDGTHHCHYDLMGILEGVTQYAYQYMVDSCDYGNWNITVSP
jgi:hypothetical protein